MASTTVYLLALGATGFALVDVVGAMAVRAQDGAERVLRGRRGNVPKPRKSPATSCSGGICRRRLGCEKRSAAHSARTP